ncbi:hypothetical protein MPH48_14870 [Lysinibacillus fusiformis]|uniref:hypothetical protein n=1 Tax=Lysinibacillus fusiformis TaxID=28031 RepID=UPI001F4EB81A|nr:hypothetical protein [Lysinibacillus fusiformis]MCK1989375.1 hypothetical protein [Lysinibacillus fusiformis]
MIEQARNFILKEVDNPALNHPDLNQKIKNKVQNSKNIVNKMKKTGDLYKYLERFHNTPIIKLYNRALLEGSSIKNRTYL